MNVELGVKVETVSETIGFWCGKCEDHCGVQITYTLTFKDEMAAGLATGCPECGSQL